MNVVANNSPDIEKVFNLFQQADWTQTRTRDEIEAMCKQSVCFTAELNGKLVGFARVVSDFIYRAYIEDVIVDEQHQKQHIGASLISAIKNEFENVEEIILSCHSGNIGFYEKQGFQVGGNQLMSLKP